MPPKVTPRPASGGGATATRRGAKTFGAPSSARKAVRAGRVRAGSSASSSSRGAFGSPSVDDGDSTVTTPDGSLHAASSSDIDDSTAASTHFTDDEADQQASGLAKAASEAQLSLDAQASAALAPLQKPSPPTRPPRKLAPRSPPAPVVHLAPSSLLSPHNGHHSDDVSAESDDHSDVSFEDARAGDDSQAITPGSPEEPLRRPEAERELNAQHMQELQKHLGFEDISFDDDDDDEDAKRTDATPEEEQEALTPAAPTHELPTPKRVSLLSNSRPVSPKTRLVDEPASFADELASPAKAPTGLVAASTGAPPALPKRTSGDTTPSLIVQPPDSSEVVPVPINKDADAPSAGLSSPSLDLPSPTVSPSGHRFSIWQRLRAASVDVQAGISPATSPSTHGVSLATPPIPESGVTSASTSPSAAAREKPLISRRPTFGALSSFSSLAAAAAAGISAQAASVREAYAGAPNVPAERVRLPRYEVDEAKLAEDVMRFADARDVLHTERDVEKLKELGQRLEEGWREKLRETHTLREKLEQAQHSLYDVEDENKHLRSSVSGLSEQIATLEATFHSFQLSTVEQMRMEKELWSEERREALDITRYEAAQARRELEAAKAVNAQLRLVVLGALRQGGNELHSIDAKLGMLGRSGVASPDATVGRQRTDSRGSARANARRSSTLASVASDDETDSSDLGLGLSPGLTSPGGTAEDGLLFDLPASPDSGRPVSMLFDQPVPLAHLKLLGLVPDESTPPTSAVSDSPQQGPPSPGTPTRGAPHSAGVGVLSRSSTSASLVSQLSAQKTAADEAHARALRDENEALRARLRDTTRSLAETQHECAELRTQVRQTEEAVSGLFDPIHL